MSFTSRIASAAARGYGMFAAVARVVDPFFNYVTALLHGDGTNGAQNNTFLDSSTNNFTITRNGNTTQGTFSPFSQTGWSTYLSSSYLTAGTTASNFLCTGSATGITATFEAWVYPTAYNTGASAWMFSAVHAKGGTYFNFGVRNGAVRFYWYDGGAKNVDSASTNDVPLNTWTHIAVTISGTTIKIYVNGALSTTSATYTGVAAAGAGQNELLGVEASGTTYFSGYISNYRFTNTVVYSAAFTPSTTPLTAISGTQLLVHQSNRFIDNSSNAFAITVTGSPSVQAFSPFNPTSAWSASSNGGSGYFDGSGDYLFAASNAAFGYGTGDFTIEMWVYPTVISASTPNLLDQRTSNPQVVPTLYLNNGVLSYYVSGANRITGATLTAGQWYHIALCRASSSTKLFLNGVQTGSTYADTNNYITSPVSIFTDGTGAGIYQAGYCADLRIVKGTALYTTTFTPPTAPLTAVSGTSLLLNYTNAGIYDNAAVGDYETVGNAQVSTSVKKYGTGSMYFDGAGDYLVTAAKPTMTLGTGDFTVEFWMYANTPQPSTRTALLSFGNGFTTNVWAIQLNNTSPSVVNQINVWAYNLNSAAVWLQGGPTIAASTWYHIAVCRNGSTFKLFVNGTQAATATSTASIDGNSTTLQWQVAYNSPDYFNGYIDDIRITKGVARYNYNFTPPAAALPDIGGTVTLTADPYYNYTTLLLPGNGTNGAQNNTFLDSSSNAFTITRNGNTTQGNFSPFSQTGWGNYFSGGYLTFTGTTAVNLYASQFTFECWVYKTSTGLAQHIYGYNNATVDFWDIYIDTSERIVFRYNGNTANITTTQTVPLAQWTHIAVAYDGTTSRVFINGTLAGSAASGIVTANGNYTANIGINLYTGGVSPFYGYMSNMRIIKGSALYTTNFTPPVTALTAVSGTSLLTCQSNRFVDNSTNAYALTATNSPSVQAFSPFAPTAAWSASTNGGSGYFDGSGDYLTTSTSSALDISTGDWTVQGWYYPTAYSAGNNVLVYVGTSAGDKIVIADISTGGSGLWYLLNGSGVITSSTKAPLNAWSFFALVKSGSTTTLYLNGVSLGTTTSVPTSSNKSVNIGSDAGAAVFQGYLSDIRILKGTANTGIPTAPLTAITNTSFLLSATNGGITDATAKNDLETVGNAQISTTQSKFGGSSMYFDGAGDYLTPANNTAGVFGTGDFTIECWVYVTGAPQANQIIWSCLTYPNTTGLYLQYPDATTINVGAGNGSSGYAVVSASTGWGWNQWIHVAVVRYSGTLTLYLNGIARGSAAFTNNCTDGLRYIGRPSDTSNYAYQGYIDDFRITKGIARYTSNFTPPTSAFLLQ